jgi:hypothetical protein
LVRAQHTGQRGAELGCEYWRVDRQRVEVDERFPDAVEVDADLVAYKRREIRLVVVRERDVLVAPTPPSDSSRFAIRTRGRAPASGAMSRA